MNISQIPYLKAIAEEKTLSGAAQKLGISQPALTRYVKNLEAMAGTPIFTSYKKRLTPTKAGEAFLQAGDDIEHIYEDMKRTLNENNNQKSDAIHLGISHSRGTSSFVRIYPAFRKRYPDTALIPKESDNNNALPLLDAGDVNIVMSTWHGYLPPCYDKIILGREEIVLAVHRKSDEPPQENPENYPIVSLRNYRNENFLVLDRRSDYETFGAVFQMNGFSPSISCKCSSMDVARTFLENDNYCMLLSANAAKPSDKITYYRLDKTLSFNVGVVFPISHKLTEAERYMTYLLSQTIRNRSGFHNVHSEQLSRIQREFSDKESEA